MVDRLMKCTKALSQGSEASLIVLTTYFHVQILVILPTHARQLTSPLSISQLPKNTDESSFEHFIEHLVGVGENSKF